MNYYTEQIKKVLDNTKKDLITIKIKSFMGEEETKNLVLPKKFIENLYNELEKDKDLNE